VQPRAQQWTAIDRSGVRAGDKVSAEAGGLPIYTVVALQNEGTLLREERSGREHVAPLSALHWKLVQ
jgi:hypothetical protein